MNDFVPDWSETEPDTDAILDNISKAIAATDRLDENVDTTDSTESSPSNEENIPPAPDINVLSNASGQSADMGKRSGSVRSNSSSSTRNKQERKERTKERHGSDSQPPVFLGDNVRTLVQQLIYTAESFDDVVLEYLERAVIEFLDECDAGHKAFHSSDDRAELLDLIIGCVPGLVIEPSRLDEFLDAALCIRLRCLLRICPP